MSNKKESFFWTSYSDLMTSLFFVMLVLFVLTIALLHHKVVEIKEINDKLMVQIKQYEQITQLEKQFKTLGESELLEYVESKRIFVARDLLGKEIFEPNKAIIKEEYLGLIDSVGVSLERIIKQINDSCPDMRFQLVIEGTAAKILYKPAENNPDNVEMYNLSYERALALYLRWRDNGINLRNYNTEIIIAGSGFNGENRDLQNEDNNKRFFIQIIPKPGNFATK